MATTTLAAIRDQMIAKVEALTPALQSDKVFRRAKRRHPIRDWASNANAGSGVFRKFEIVRSGEAEDPPYVGTTEVERAERLTITVAYHVAPGAFDDELDGLHELMRRDAQQIRDAVFSSSNYLSGQLAAFVTILSPDTAGEAVWYQDFDVLVRYYESQTI